MLSNILSTYFIVWDIWFFSKVPASKHYQIAAKLSTGIEYRVILLPAGHILLEQNCQRCCLLDTFAHVLESYCQLEMIPYETLRPIEQNLFFFAYYCQLTHHLYSETQYSVSKLQLFLHLFPFLRLPLLVNQYWRLLFRCQCCVSGSFCRHSLDADPDPADLAPGSGSLLGMRIRIQKQGNWPNLSN